MFIATRPLPRGAHDFGLVIKEVRGGVRVPAPGQAPATQDGAESLTAAETARRLAERGVRIGANGPNRMRAVTHLDLSAAAVAEAAETLAEVLDDG